MSILLNRTIDHTILKPDCTQQQIIQLCAEAVQHNFASVCVLPWHVGLAKKYCSGSEVAVCTVIGFPLGATDTTTKLVETQTAMRNGASEIDIVINISALKSGLHDVVFQDIYTLTQEVQSAGGIIKVIIETCLLTDAEKISCCEMVNKAGADFIKTSTGFSTGGATVADVHLMRTYCVPAVHIKASGGIRTREAALEMIAAGATRIGTSSGVTIVG